MQLIPLRKTIGELLEGAFYRIPRYQRPYSWQSGNLEEFWDDLVRSKPNEYFIGPMVFYTRGQGDAAKTIDVVDGQQRLTTATLLLAAIRNAFSAANEGALADRLHSFIERTDVNAVRLYVLEVEQEYPYFQQAILPASGAAKPAKANEDERSIVEAFEFFSRQIRAQEKNISENPSIAKVDKASAFVEFLKGLRDKVLNLVVIAIYLDTEDDAYTVFETLNTRGQDLATADLIKNLIMKSKREANSSLDVTRDEWKKFVETLGGLTRLRTVDELISYSWMSRGEYTSRQKLYASIKKLVSTNAQVDEFWEGLKTDAQLYVAVRDPDAVDWQTEEFGLASSLAALNLFAVAQPSPLLLAVLRALRAGHMKLKTVNAAVSAIEKFHFLNTAIAGISSSGGISKMYATDAKSIFKAGADANAIGVVVKALVEKLRERSPPYEVFESGFVGLEYANDLKKDRQLVRYVLGAMYRQQKKESGQDFSQWTVEHLAPQSDESLDDRFRIGNLIFVPKEINDALGTKPIEAKLKVLKSQNYPMDETLATASFWDAKKIDERGKKLSRFAFDEVWSI